MARKMKDNGIEWIGEIPEGWEVTKLKYLATFPIEKNAHIDSPYIGLENIESWTGKYVSSDSQYDKSQALTFSRNNILFGKLRPYLAKVFCASNDGCCSSEFCILNFSSSVNIRYFWNLLISPTFIDHVTKSTYGTKMPRANTDFIKNICAPVPPRIEQDRIALYLDASSTKIDSLVSETRSSIEEYKKLKQAVITQAVTKGVRGEREMKDSGVEWIGEIPEEWNAIKEKIGSAVDTSELDRQADAIKAQLRQRLSTKSRLEHQMDTLDFNDPYYDRKALDLQRRYDEQYELIEDMETQLAEIQGQIDDIHQEKITADNIYHLLLAFDEVYNAATEVEQKEFMRAFIERIDIFPEKQPNGNWIRNIVFAFPVPYNGKEIREFPLESQSTVECVLLMSKAQ